MPEIKHDFSAGKMNKDLDERIVPNGEYRHAMNVQVRTTGSDGGVGNAGTVQNVKGNKRIKENASYETSYAYDGNESKIIASVSNEKTNTAYFFISSPDFNKSLINNSSQVTSRKKFIDTIVEIDTGTGSSAPTALPVVVDVWAIIDTTSSGLLESNNDNVGLWRKFEVQVVDGVRVGMTVQFYNSNSIPLLENGPQEIQEIETNSLGGGEIVLYSEQESINWDDVSFVMFRSQKRVLNFNTHTKITGINVIDDLLFWTDNESEPKKINIKRCKEGSIAGNSLEDSDWLRHTQLKLKNPNDSDELVDYTDDLESSLSPSVNNDLKEEHLTVIRRAPLMAPTIEMRRTDRESQVTFIPNYFFNFAALNNGDGVEPGDEVSLGYNGINEDYILDGIDWRENDVLSFESGSGDFITASVISINTINCGEDPDDDPTTEEPDDDGDGIANYLDDDCNDGEQTLTLNILTVSAQLQYVGLDDNGLPLSDVIGFWDITLQQKNPLFELKMGRFSLRYKYEDGEYSSFGPWSELAFLPGPFDYDHKKGYNLGMTNTIRELIIKDFIPHQRTKGADISAVDILYKTTESPNVYVVKTVTRGKDDEWDLFTISSPNAASTDYMFGEFSLTSEMIHKTLPETQTMRAWDNVPRYALGQEIAANRLVYANYEQGYEIENPLGLKQTLISKELQEVDIPHKSVKSIRNYKVGLVFGDEYGRETPVIAPTDLITLDEIPQTVVDGSVYVDKKFAGFKNNFRLQQDWLNNSSPDNWISYVKYYIKETSSEYYNLVMDRWYNAEDGNIWLSFISADRNKLDEQTYLILKKQHGSSIPVEEKARYKVIAIENEAPIFIKRDPRPMGEIKLGSGSFEYMFEGTISNVELSNPPILLMDGNEVRISNGDWGDFLEDYDHQSTKGELEIRIKAMSGGVPLNSNKWETVSYFQPSTSDDPARVMWSRPLGNHANLYQRFVDLTGNETLSDITYYLEFREMVFKNKAEFDGKFFVKIEKDEILENKVLLYGGADESWVEDMTYAAAYVDNQQYNPSATVCEYCDENDEDGNPYMPRKNYRWMDDSSGVTGAEDNNSPPATGGDNPGYNNTVDVSNLFNDRDCLGSYGEYDIGSETEQTIVVDSDGDWNTAITSSCYSYDSIYLSLGCADLDGVAGAEVHDHYGNYEDTPVIDSDADYGGVNDNENVINRAWYSYKFWNWLKYTAMGTGSQQTSGELGTKIFIDGARTRSTRVSVNNVPWICDGPRDPSTGECQDTPTPISSTGKHPGDYYKHTGIDQGVLEKEGEYGPTASGHLGRVTFSSMSNYTNEDYWKAGWGYSSEGQNQFRTRMTTKLTLFRFTDDPDNKVYQVITSSNQEDPHGWDNFVSRNYSELIGDDETTSWYGPFETQNLFASDYYSVDLEWFGVCSNGSLSASVGTDNEYEFPGNEYIGLNISYPQAPSNEWIPFGVFPMAWYRPGCPFYGRNEEWSYLNFSNHNPNHHNTGNTESQIKVGGLSQYAPSDSTYVFRDAICRECGTMYAQYFGSTGQNYLEACHRTSFRIEFREYDLDSQSLKEGGTLGIDTSVWDPRGVITHDGREAMAIATMRRSLTDAEVVIPIANAAIWETEPKESVGLDIYYEASNAIPVRLNNENTSNFAPYGSKVTRKLWDGISESYVEGDMVNTNHYVFHIGYTQTHSIVGVKATDPNGDEVLQTNSIGIGDYIVFHHPDGTQTMAQVDCYMKPVDSDNVELDPNFQGLGVDTLTETLFVEQEDLDANGWPIKTGYYKLDTEVWKYPIELAWHNCWTFGNGVESDRIRDDYNANQIDNGVKVSTTFLDYGRERKGSGMIYSGLYNSTAGVNDLNEFNMAEKITKDINPSYGSIQRIKTRDTDVVVLAEDKTLKITTNKDALFNADGNPQLLASNRVLGTAVPFSGDYGISSNPESLAFDQYRLYFTDMQRGAVMRLSRDGLTPISEVGMKTWFRENLKKTDSLLGTFDTVNGEYNLTLKYKESENLKNTTVSFNERSKGWVSFKSFVPQAGESVGGKYLTAISQDINNPNTNTGKEKKGIFEHYVDITRADTSAQDFNEVINRNTFYASNDTIQGVVGSPSTTQYYENSVLTVMFNDMPDIVKSFKSTSYEGSQGRVDQFLSSPSTTVDPAGNPFANQTDGEYYNLTQKDGWFVSNIITDLSFSGHIHEFVEKEGKWFNNVSGRIREEMTNEDLSEFSVQGLGTNATIIKPGEEVEEEVVTTDRPLDPIGPTISDTPDDVEESISINITSDMIDDTDNPFDPLADNNQ